MITAAYASQKLSVPPRKTAFGCCSHPCKNTCHSTYLRALKVVWEQAHGVPRAFAQRVYESAQGEGPLEGTEEYLAELLASALMVLWLWHLAEGSLVLIPTPNLAQQVCLIWTEPKRSAGCKQLAQKLAISAVRAGVCSPPVLSLCLRDTLSSACSLLAFCPAPACSVQSNTRHDAVVPSIENPYGHSWGTEDSTAHERFPPLFTSRELEVLQ